MATSLLPDNKQLIYLYDLPKSLVTSVKIAKIIKDFSGYDLQEPVQFRDCKPHPVTGLASPFQYGIIKVDGNQWTAVSKAIKYFDIEDGVEADGTPRKWQCRALPFDRELLGANKTSTNTQLNVFVKGIKEDLATKELDKEFSEKFGEVKSAKISQSIKGKADVSAPPTSNGYGFVCFQNKESLEKAVSQQVIDGMEIIRYQPKDPREARKVYNNIYVKNFSPAWDEAYLRTLFAKYGDIKSLVVMKKLGKDGQEKPFAFVCYDKNDDKNYGPLCADRAVSDLHDKEFDGFKIYVQPAVPHEQRQAQVQREQQRFKNSKKKCNLFVKGFPATFKEENLRELFAPYGEIESIKIIQSNDETGAPKPYGSRAFVCYKQPDSAANARARLHQQIIDGKQLYVTNYELPEIRKKQQVEAKDRADFMTQRKLTAAPLDSALLTRPDTIQLIQQILFLIQRQMGGRFPNGYQQYGNRPQMPRNNQRPGFQNRGPQGPRPYNQQQVGQVPQPVPQQQVPTAPAQPTQFTIKGDLQPLAHPDPFINAYNQKGFTLLPVVVPNNPNLKQFVGEFIYEFVEKIVGEEKAPKITGMLIDLPLEEIKGYLYDFMKLNQKVYEAVQILNQISAQQQQ